MALKLFNTLTRTIEEFAPLDPAGRAVGMYCCGPTVYDLAHIGNFRTFIFADLVRRYLEFRGYGVRHVMNVTDVDDKIIARVRAAGVPLAEFTRRYEAAFLEDLDVLGCRRPHHLPRATEHIEPMLDLIGRLIDHGLAYQSADGSVYFSIQQYIARGHRYGQLVRINLDELRAGERIRSDEYAKETAADFALWKSRAPEDGDVFWASPWGEGRPGWHIECSAMSRHLLGETFDLHLGGEDLAFPHHEDEIAQSEGAMDPARPRQFVRYWLHGAHLLVEGQKMAKSLGNFFTLRDLVARGYSGREIRYLLLGAHYREPFNFTFEGLQGARAALARIDECIGKLRDCGAGKSAEPDPALIDEFTRALDDDLNASAGWAAVFEWIRRQNRRLSEGSIPPVEAAAGLAAWERIDSVLGIGARPAAEAPPEIQALLAERQAARKNRDFARADALRAALKDQGWLIEDTPAGPKLKRK